ncbi:MAG TPA: hypothetical protein VF588_22300 [Pyrinomonadaceae bacterium]|jgi:hypothetical protein
MRVVSIRSKQFLGGYTSQRAGVVPEWAWFIAGASVTTLGPTLLYCAVSLQLVPLYVMTCVAALGVAAGVVMSKMPADDFMLRLPMSGAPDVPGGTLTGRSKKAA